MHFNYLYINAMTRILTKQEVGQRIAHLRKMKGFSQEDLAKKVNISRPSVAQIELGNRGIDILELKEFSNVLGFSIDYFVSENFEPSKTNGTNPADHQKGTEERVSTPILNIDKLKNILLYTLERCSGKSNVGETVLYKLLYFMDFNYFEIYEEHLTGAKYMKLPFGPVPQDIDHIINQMIDKGQLQRVKTGYHNYMQTRYLPLVKPDLSELNANEKDVIDKVIGQMSDWSAAVLSSYAHKDLPWMAAMEGEEINYELTFYRETPYSVRNYDDMEE